MMGGGTQLVLGNTPSTIPYIEIIDNKIISNDGTEEWDISNNIPNTDPEIVGEVYVWGDNFYGQLGLGNRQTLYSTVKLFDTKWKKISCYRHTLGIDEHNDLWGWGLNSNGESGVGNKNSYQVTPVKIAPDTKWKDIHCGEHFSFALSKDGDWYGWGNLANYQLGAHGTIWQLTPIKAAFKTKWKQFATVSSPIFAIGEDDYPYVWGAADYNIGYPRKFLNTKCKHISYCNVFYTPNAGSGFIISELGELYSWGYNRYGQLGLGNSAHETIYSPTKIFFETKWKDACTTIGGSFILSEDNDLYVWGANDSGRLGLGYTSPPASVIFTPIKHPKKYTKLISIRDGVFALSTDGYWYAWGRNDCLGIGDSSLTGTKPVKIDNIPWKTIFPGEGYGFRMI